MPRERVAGRFAESGHDVDRPGGETALRGQLGECDDRTRRILRRLDHRRVTDSERWRKRAGKHLQRVVPRDDVAAHAGGNAQHLNAVPGEVGDRLAVQFVRAAGIKLEVARRGRNVGATLRDRLPGVVGFDLREPLAVRNDRCPELREEPSALERRQRAPRTLERSDGAAHRPVDIHGIAGRDSARRRAGRRIHHRQRLARTRLLETSVDEEGLRGS